MRSIDKFLYDACGEQGGACANCPRGSKEKARHDKEDCVDSSIQATTGSQSSPEKSHFTLVQHQAALPQVQTEAVTHMGCVCSCPKDPPQGIKCLLNLVAANFLEGIKWALVLADGSRQVGLLLLLW